VRVGSAGHDINIQRCTRIAGPRADGVSANEYVFDAGRAQYRDNITRTDVLPLHARKPFAQANVVGEL